MSRPIVDAADNLGLGLHNPDHQGQTGVTLRKLKITPVAKARMNEIAQVQSPLRILCRN